MRKPSCFRIRIAALWVCVPMLLLIPLHNAAKTEAGPPSATVAPATPTPTPTPQQTATPVPRQTATLMPQQTATPVPEIKPSSLSLNTGEAATEPPLRTLEQGSSGEDVLRFKLRLQELGRINMLERPVVLGLALLILTTLLLPAWRRGQAR